MDGQTAINTTTRRGEYQSGGWTRHDETAEPYVSGSTTGLTGGTTTGTTTTGLGGTGIGTGLPSRTEVP